MTRYLKSTILVVAGLCWLGVAAVLGFLLLHYLAGGAGLQTFGYFFGVSSVTLLVGLLHFVGIAAAACLCFVIGVGLCAHGLVPAPAPAPEAGPQPAIEPKPRFALLRRLTTSTSTSESPGPALRCVRCRTPLPAPVHLCPECGWTQPKYANLR